MSYEPTEELFDHLMKGWNSSKEDYSNSDGESDEVYEKENPVVEEIIDDIQQKDGSSPATVSTCVESDSTADAKMDDTPCGSEVNADQESLCNPLDEPESTPPPAEPESCSKEKESESNLPVDEGFTEELGVALDPSDTGVFDSVETVTIDVNQKSQDEETVCSDMVTDVDLDKNQEATKDSSLEAVQVSDNSITGSQPADVTCTLPNDESNSVNISIENSEVIPNLQLNISTDKDETKTAEQTYDLRNGQYLKSLRLFSNLLSDTGSKTDENPSSAEDCEETRLGCRSYDCGGCHSKFWVLRFYYHHLRRVTTKILYDCKQCQQKMKFTNPCLLKLHMQSHGESVDKINILESDVTVETPDIVEFKEKYLAEFDEVSVEKTLGMSMVEADHSFECPQCLLRVPSLVEHLAYDPGVKGATYRCPVCRFMFTSKCSLEIHRRLHNQKKPYCCPECGSSFITHSRLQYHVHLECYHFSRRETVRCEQCSGILPSKKAFYNHWMLTHRTLMYKCRFCSRVFKTVPEFSVHLEEEHQVKSKQCHFSVYHRCDLCRSDQLRIFSHRDYVRHLTIHTNDRANTFYCFRCVKCSFITQNPVSFQVHMETMSACRLTIDKTFKSSHPEVAIPLKKRKCAEYKNKIVGKKLCGLYLKDKNDKRVSVGQGKRPIPKISEPKKVEPEPMEEAKISCLLCSRKFQRSDQIRSHIISYHKCDEYHRYVQISCNVKPSPKSKTVEKDSGKCKVPSTSNARSSKRKDIFSCPSCDYLAESKDDFQNHVVVHREDGAYQCLECGECFVCKNTLEIHLISVHSIKDTSSYISSHFVHNSLPKPCDTSEELQPNQCSVCFDIFPDDKALRLHFRSHGMAFLRQSFAKRIST